MEGENFGAESQRKEMPATTEFSAAEAAAQGYDPLEVGAAVLRKLGFSVGLGGNRIDDRRTSVEISVRDAAGKEVLNTKIGRDALDRL